jgi:hypothetical protein
MFSAKRFVQVGDKWLNAALLRLWTSATVGAPTTARAVVGAGASTAWGRQASLWLWHTLDTR